MHAVTMPPPVPVGEIKRFGPFGPKYEVGRALDPLDDGDWWVEITLIETGEKARHLLTHLNNDPAAY